MSAFGTDKYPPFSLRLDPAYPADFDVDYPAHLSRALVLVKWRLLAIPHYLIVALFAGGWSVAFRHGAWQVTGTGLVALLAVIAMVMTLFGRRYPQQLFDLVMGMNRCPRSTATPPATPPERTHRMCTDERDVEALAELSTADCLELLRGHDFGRVAFAADGVPVILPVNYGFEEPHVVVRTAPGLKLDEMPMRIVAFEIDDADPARTWGWSVVVQGPAFEITDSVDPLSVALRASTVQPAAPGERGCWLRISARQVTGRAFGPWRLHAPPSVLSPAGPTPEGDL